MLNLSYSACYDPYNTIFRMSVLLSKSTTKSMLIETLKIADFFLCFPSRLEEIKPPNSVKGMRGRCNRVLRDLKKNQFEILPASEVLFDRMDIIQETSISAMYSKEIITISGEGDNRELFLAFDMLSSPLTEKIDNFSSLNTELVNLLAVDFNKIQVLGSNGLKARTGLGDYVYDTV